MHLHFGEKNISMLDNIRPVKYVTERVYYSDKDNYISGERLEIGSDFDLLVGWVFYRRRSGESLT